MRDEYRYILEEIADSFSSDADSVQTVNNDSEMNGDPPYVDGYTTGEQRKRDAKITELLNEYVSGYAYKNASNKWYKGILLGISLLILLILSGVFIYLVLKIFSVDSNDEVTVAGLIEVISICITFLTLIIGILKIITKNVFPENEEQYITKIVEIIQNNDLENKKENIKAKDQSDDDD
jgi:hypothetical protein